MSRNNWGSSKKWQSEGGGGTTDYENLDNKPQINGVELNGNVNSGVLGIDGHFKGWYNTLAELKTAHIAVEGDSAYVKDASPATTWSIYVYDATATTDNNWADSGTDADTSNVQTFKTGEELTDVGIDSVPSLESENLVESGGVFSVITRSSLELQDPVFTEGSGVLYNNGNDYTNAGIKTTGLIPVTQGDIVYYCGKKWLSTAFGAILCYNSQKEYVKDSSLNMNEITTNTEYAFTIPAGISYIKLSASIDGYKYIILNSVLLTLLKQYELSNNAAVSGLDSTLTSLSTFVNTNVSTIYSLLSFCIPSEDFITGYIDSTSYAYTSSTKRITCVQYFDIPVDKRIKIDITRQSQSFSIVRLIQYDSYHNIISTITKNFSDGVVTYTSSDLDNSATKFRVCLFSDSDVNIASLGEIYISAEYEKISNYAYIQELQVAATEYDCSVLTNRVIAGDSDSGKIKGDIFNVNDRYCYVLTNNGFRWLKAIVKSADKTRPCVAFYSEEEPSSSSLIASYCNDAMLNIFSLEIPNNCKCIVVCRDVRSTYTSLPFSISVYSPRVTANILKNKDRIENLENLGVDDAYDTESVKVNKEAVALDCDFRFLAFADPHELVDEKYYKYRNIASKGVVDCVIGLGDYNPYRTYERNELKFLLTDIISKSGREANKIYVVGNHDVMADFDWIWQRGAYAEVQPPISTDYVYTKKEQFEIMTHHLCHTAVFNPLDPYGCYYYIDFEPQKTRIIILNSSDIYEDDGTLQYYYKELMAFHQKQITWFTDVALDFMDKGIDRSNWHVAVFVHHITPNPLMFADILSAVKNGSNLVGSWNNSKKREYDETTHKYLGTYTDDGVTVTANKNYTEQGAIDVIGVFHGHSHNDVTKVIGNSDIKRFEFISDGYTNHLWKAEVNGLTAGQYYFKVLTGNKKYYEFQLEDALPSAKYVAYNSYFDTSSASMEEYIFDDENKIIWFKVLSPQDTAPVSGTEITDFVDTEDTEVKKEKCAIVCLDYSNKTMISYPFGNASYREETW